MFFSLVFGRRQSKVERKAAEVLERAKIDFRSRRACEAYPQHADSETRKFIRYWFDEYARRQLASLAEAIHRVRDDRVRDTLWCAFSRLIITKQAGASLAMDLSHSRPHRVFDHAPIKPLEKFIAAVHQVLKNCICSMHSAVEETARVLTPGGKAVYVVGENTVRGTFIPNAKIVSAVAELSGLKIENRRGRALPANRRYIPPP